MSHEPSAIALAVALAFIVICTLIAYLPVFFNYLQPKFRRYQLECDLAYWESIREDAPKRISAIVKELHQLEISEKGEAPL